MANTPVKWLEKAISEGHINNLEYDQFTDPKMIGIGAFGKHSKNILIHQRQPKIADFGLSKQINETSMTSNSIVCGMPAYVEPRCLFDQKYRRDKRSDVYSAGVILWEISSGKPPFQDCTKETIVINIYQRKRENPIEATYS
ncbi:kinase-like protein [Gigaspora margarita]|uniref:Kinase-like protein n=1 Tax=Gigaspora margarita TaxID=4874 RepID=A0A8H4ESX7_GIGMA|nr:kinase-like protein [Gigaspora margarita]